MIRWGHSRVEDQEKSLREEEKEKEQKASVYIPFPFIVAKQNKPNESSLSTSQPQAPGPVYCLQIPQYLLANRDLLNAQQFYWRRQFGKVETIQGEALLFYQHCAGAMRWVQLSATCLVHPFGTQDSFLTCLSLTYCLVRESDGWKQTRVEGFTEGI